MYSERTSQFKNDIIKTILYFDIFSYPLTFSELLAHHSNQAGSAELEAALKELVGEGRLKSSGKYYMSALADGSGVQRRNSGNKMAQEIMPTAIRCACIINRFPFVRSVNISGSLSKNYYDESSDIDFFIITRAGRLWICRTLLTLYWKSLPKSRKRFFCTNYFVDETVLEMDEKNQFTAVELAYLVPVINGSATQTLLKNNTWLRDHVGNKKPDLSHEIKPGDSFFKKIAEAFFAGAFGSWIDNLLLKQTIRHWRKKYPEMQEKDFELQFRSRKNVCKRHTKGFQNKVLQAWSNKQQEYEKAFLVPLNLKNHIGHIDT